MSIIHTLESEADARPQWRGDDIPWCTRDCHHHDGKRCLLTGTRAPIYCDPVISAAVHLLRSRK